MELMGENRNGTYVNTNVKNDEYASPNQGFQSLPWPPKTMTMSSLPWRSAVYGLPTSFKPPVCPKPYTPPPCGNTPVAKNVNWLDKVNNRDSTESSGTCEPRRIIPMKHIYPDSKMPYGAKCYEVPDKIECTSGACQGSQLANRRVTVGGKVFCLPGECFPDAKGDYSSSNYAKQPDVNPQNGGGSSVQRDNCNCQQSTSSSGGAQREVNGVMRPCTPPLGRAAELSNFLEAMREEKDPRGFLKSNPSYPSQEPWKSKEERRADERSMMIRNNGGEAAQTKADAIGYCCTFDFKPSIDSGSLLTPKQKVNKNTDKLILEMNDLVSRRDNLYRKLEAIECSLCQAKGLQIGRPPLQSCLPPGLKQEIHEMEKARYMVMNDIRSVTTDIKQNLIQQRENDNEITRLIVSEAYTGDDRLYC